MTPFEGAPAIRLRSAYLRMHRAVNHLLRPHGITADQYVVLRFLAEQDGVPQQSLVDLCDSDPTTIGRMLEILEGKNVIARREHPSDGRCRLVYLTHTGRAVCARLVEATAAIRKVFETALPPRELENLLVSLDTLGAAFKLLLKDNGVG